MVDRVSAVERRKAIMDALRRIIAPHVLSSVGMQHCSICDDARSLLSHFDALASEAERAEALRRSIRYLIDHWAGDCAMQEETDACGS